MLPIGVSCFSGPRVVDAPLGSTRILGVIGAGDGFALSARAAFTMMRSYTWRILLVCAACMASIAARGGAPQHPSPPRGALVRQVLGLRMSLTLRGGAEGVDATEGTGSRVPASDVGGGKKRARDAELDAVSGEEGDEHKLAAAVASHIVAKRQRREAAAAAEGGAGASHSNLPLKGEEVKVGAAHDVGGNATAKAGKSGGVVRAVLRVEPFGSNEIKP